MVFKSLTVLKVLEAFILDFELEWVDEEGRIVQNVHGRDVYGRHAALSGPKSLNVLDGTGSVRAQCALFQLNPLSIVLSSLTSSCSILLPPL